jgi:hypothetical protein
MYSFQRVSIDTHNMMNFTIIKNISDDRHDIKYTVTNAMAK